MRLPQPSKKEQKRKTPCDLDGFLVGGRWAGGEGGAGRGGEASARQRFELKFLFLFYLD